MLFFWVYKDATGQFRWRLYAANNRIIADSGEGYHNKKDCVDAIDLVASTRGAQIRYAPGA